MLLPRLGTTFKPRLADYIVKGLKFVGRITVLSMDGSFPNSNGISEWKLRGFPKVPETTYLRVKL